MSNANKDPWNPHGLPEVREDHLEEAFNQILGDPAYNSLGSQLYRAVTGDSFPNDAVGLIAALREAVLYRAEHLAEEEAGNK